MKRRPWLAIYLGALAVLALAIAGFTVWLVFPGRPSETASLSFDGFVMLPSQHGHGALEVLDYMSVNGRTLFVTSESTGAVDAIALDDTAAPGHLAIRQLRGRPAAHGVAVDPVSGLAFASRSGINEVAVFNPRTMAPVKSIRVPDDADGVLYAPSQKLIYVVNGDPNVATLIDPATQALAGTVALGGKPEFAVYDPRTGLVLQNLADRNQVAAVDLSRKAVVGVWPIAGCEEPTGMALDDADRQLFVVCAKNARLVVLDLASHRAIADMPIGGGPDAVAFDPELHRLYATGKSGVLSVILQETPNSYRTIGTVKLHYGAHTLAVDPVTHRLYVGYASLFVPARVAVFDPRT